MILHTIGIQTYKKHKKHGIIYITIITYNQLSIVIIETIILLTQKSDPY
jgi:hypothetical protein